jgi:hypothetical protein
MIEALRSDKKLYEEIRKTVEKAIKAKKEGDKKE